jgi:enoyl-CoA hydratase/carnithine racemase
MTTPQASEGVAIESRDGVLRITLDRPSRKNSLDAPPVRRIVRIAQSV